MRGGTGRPTAQHYAPGPRSVRCLPCHQERHGAMCEWYVAPTCCVLVRWIGRKKARCVPLTSLRARSPAFGARGRVSRQSACAYSEMWLSRLAPLGIIIRPQLAVGARLQTPTRTCTDPATLRSSSRPGLEGVGGECTSGCDVCAEMAPPKRGSGSRGRGCPPWQVKGLRGRGFGPRSWLANCRVRVVVALCKCLTLIVLSR